jgi:hypothetical protein
MILQITSAPRLFVVTWNNAVDDDPSPVSRWLPEFAHWVGASPPPHLTEPEACEAAGERVGL